MLLHRGDVAGSSDPYSTTNSRHFCNQVARRLLPFAFSQLRGVCYRCHTLSKFNEWNGRIEGFPYVRTRSLALIFGLSLFAVACGNDLDGSAAVDDVGAPETTLAPLDPALEGFDGIPDRTTAVVELGDVFFDTFDGNATPLSEASNEDIIRLLDAIPPIDNPPYINPSDDEWLEDEDLILGYIDAEGQAYAYPHKILNFHEIVNDTLADTPVLISYCPLCNSGVVFDRRPDDLRHDGELTFSNTSALYDNDMVMVDRQTSSYWWQVPGRGIVGTLSGAELTVLPSVTTTWAQWQIDQPNTLLLSRELGFSRDYTRDPFSSYADRVNAGSTPFPVNPEALADDRLRPATRVIAIEVGDDAVAVPVIGLLTDLEVTVGGVDHVVRPDGGGGAQAFAVTADGTLEPAPSRSTFWFAYVASFPNARVEGP